MKYRKMTIAFLSIFIVFVIIGSEMVQGAEPKFVIKASEGNPWDPEHPYCFGIDYLGRRIEKLTNNRVEVTCYYGTLGSESAMTNDLIIGTLDIVAASTATLSGIVKESGLLNLASIFNGDTREKKFENVWKVMEGPFGEWLGEKTLKKGIRIVGWWRLGSFSLFSNVPIRKLEDLRGVKIRTLSSREQLELYKAYGAIPVPMSHKEMYTALQTGVVDGIISNVISVWSEHIHEVIKYHTELNDLLLVVPIMISDKKWKTFSGDIQKAILQAAGESEDLVRKQDAKYHSEIKQRLINYGVKVFELAPQEQRKFEEVAKREVWPKFLVGEEEKLWFKKLRKAQE